MFNLFSISSSRTKKTFHCGVFESRKTNRFCILYFDRLCADLLSLVVEAEAAETKSWLPLHRMAWVEKDHSDHLVSTPLLCAGLPDQAAQSHIQPGVECLQGSTTSLGNLSQCVTTLCLKNFFLIWNLHLPVFI